MSSWFEALPAFAAALLILALPGAAVLMALRVRGLMAVFLAPAVSVSVVAASAITAPLVGLPWHLPVLLLGTAIAAILGGAYTFISFANHRRRTRALAAQAPR